MEDTDRRKIMKNMAKLLDSIKPTTALHVQMVQRNLLTPSACDQLAGVVGERERCRQTLMECTRRGPTAFRQLTLALLETGQLGAARLLQPDISLRDLVPTDATAAAAAGYSGAGGGEAVGRPRADSVAVRAVAKLAMAGAGGGGDPGPDPFRGRTASNATRPSPASEAVAPSVETVAEDEVEGGGDGVGVLSLKVKPASDYRGAPIHTDAYRMMSTPRGLALIINNVMFRDEELHSHRIGSEVDEKNLVSVLTQLGYKVETRRDLDRRSMSNAIYEFSGQAELATVDSCILAILTHGGQNVVYGVDSRPLENEEVVRAFNHDNCPTMIGKPKWLIFQACRGAESNLVTKNRVVSAATVATDGQPVSSAPDASLGEQSDLFLTYSTIPGYVSIRDRDLGTWLIQLLCEVMAELAATRDLQELHTICQDRMTYIISSANEKQTMETAQRGFRRKMYFNPGI